MITHKLPMYKTHEGFKIVSEAEEAVKVIIESYKYSIYVFLSIFQA